MAALSLLPPRGDDALGSCMDMLGHVHGCLVFRTVLRLLPGKNPDALARTATPGIDTATAQGINL